jgi:DNA-binding transcriptional ArsR family regulator
MTNCPLPGEGTMAGRKLTADQLHHIADRFKALAEPSRLGILQSLKEREHTVSEILQATGLGQANVSRHLQVLFAAGLVNRRKDGVSTWYRLADPDVLRLCDLMCGRLERELSVKRKAFSG